VYAFWVKPSVIPPAQMVSL